MKKNNNNDRRKIIACTCRKAAERGLPEAQFNLGMCLSRGVEKNVAEGAMWLNSAARQGDAEAEWILKQWWGD